MNSKNILRSLASSAGVVLYVAGVAWLMQNVSKYLGTAPSPVLAGTAMLMLFVLSAAITGGLVLGYPIYLYFENKKKEAIASFLLNLGFLAVFVLLTFGIIFWSYGFVSNY